MPLTRICHPIPILLSAFVGGMPLYGAPASANSHLNCNAYAQAAVKQHFENKQLGCGFAGGAWSGDYTAHLNWCKSGAQMADLTREDNGRKQALQQCKQAKNATPARPANAPTKNECRNYAKAMVSYAKTNAETQCGFTGGQFADDYNGHYNWCYNGPTKTQVRGVLNDTKAKIVQCGKAKKKQIQNTRVFKNPTSKHNTELPLDVCWFSNGKICNWAAAHNYCGEQGYKEAINIKKSSTTLASVHGAGGTCIGTGNSGACGIFTSITCRGKL